MTFEPPTGIIAAPYLPRKQDPRIAWPILRRHMDWIATPKPRDEIVGGILAGLRHGSKEAPH